MKKRRLIVLPIAIVIFAGAIVGWWVSQPSPFDHPAVGVPIAHAAGGMNTECAECHLEPISGGCAACHSSPPTTIAGAKYNIDFSKHHGGSGGPSCDSCHGTGDARYAQVPTAEHSFCTSCHSLQHG